MVLCDLKFYLLFKQEIQIWLVVHKGAMQCTNIKLTSTANDTSEIVETLKVVRTKVTSVYVMRVFSLQ